MQLVRPESQNQGQISSFEVRQSQQQSYKMISNIATPAPCLGGLGYISTRRPATMIANLMLLPG